MLQRWKKEAKCNNTVHENTLKCRDTRIKLIKSSKKISNANLTKYFIILQSGLLQHGL